MYLSLDGGLAVERGSRVGCLIWGWVVLSVLGVGGCLSVNFEWCLL